MGQFLPGCRREPKLTPYDTIATYRKEGRTVILYATKKTIERFKLKLPQDMNDPMVARLGKTILAVEKGDELVEWGAKLFYFDGRKSIQLVNFASRLTFFLVDVHPDEVDNIGGMLTGYLYNLYRDTPDMKELLDRYFEEHQLIVFSPLTNKSVLGTLNYTQESYVERGSLYEYIWDGLFHSLELNKKFNQEWIFSKMEQGERIYFNPGERFEALLRARYQGSAST